MRFGSVFCRFFIIFAGSMPLRHRYQVSCIKIIHKWTEYPKLQKIFWQ